ncbi:acyl-CoA dehydrogenase family protein [Cytobacillus horneckiae]|uniref:acyl-CoA dehydrogenase family protein n=1 Tax=Cytobacillus horneckiae TaxID=549687 RepID=UPI003D9A55E0
MEYRYTEQQLMLKKALNTLLKKEMPFETFVEIAEKENGFSKKKWMKLAENGWLGILAHGEFQTLEEVDTLDLMYLAESIGASLFPGPFSLTSGFVVPLMSQLPLTDNQKSVLEAIIGGEAVAAAVLPKLVKRDETYFQYPEVELKKVKQHYEISGSYQHLQFLQNADYIILPIEDNDQSFVALISTKQENVIISAEESVDLSKPQGTLVLKKAVVTEEELITSEKLKDLISESLRSYFIAINGEIIGGADEVLNRTVHFVSERKQFGVPVGSFQAVKHMIADIKVEIEKARSYSIYIHSIAEDEEKVTLNLLCSRYFNTDMYKKICESSIQLHGGMGFTWEESIHFWYKAAMYQLYHLTHPALMEDYIHQNLLNTVKNKELHYHN